RSPPVGIVRACLLHRLHVRSLRRSSSATAGCHAITDLKLSPAVEVAGSSFPRGSNHFFFGEGVVFKRVLVFTALVGVGFWCGGLRTWAAPKESQIKEFKKSDDLTFVRKAASAGMAEVALGQLAAKHGHSERVRKFGQRMVEDHTKANRELMEIARSNGMTFTAKM